MEGALLVFLAAVYFVPTIVASVREHRNMAGIVILNLLLGWTILGWIGALVWAVTSAQEQK